MSTTIYKGFSTKNYEDSGGSLGLYDIQLIKENIMRHLFTVPGERIMLRNFGTRLRLMTFEQNDMDVKEAVRDDMLKVFANEPRVEVLSIDILSSEDDNTLICLAKLRYLPFNVVDETRLEINIKD